MRLQAQLAAVGFMQRCRETHMQVQDLRECGAESFTATHWCAYLVQGLAVSYQTAPVVTATSVTYPFVQDVVLGFPGGVNASRELVAFDPLTATMRWTVSQYVHLIL